MEIKDLPAELLEQIHLRLPPSALKKAVLVCQLWRAVGEEPTLWEWCTVTVYSREDVTNLANRRLQRIQQISISPEEWNTGDWEVFFLATMELHCLSKIDGRIDGIGNSFLRAREAFFHATMELHCLSKIDGRIDGKGNAFLLAVDPDLFARSLARLEMVDVSGCAFKQIEALFNKMSQGTKLKKLRLSSHDLSQMDPGLFAEVLSKLEDVKLDANKTTNEQMKALFTQIADESRLKRLYLNEESASQLGPELFARALAKIEAVRVDNDVTNHQIMELFTALAHETQMKKLVLRLVNVDVSEVNPGLFSKALSRLEEVELHSRHTTNDQIQALFAQMSVKTHLKMLILPCSNLSRLNPGLFSMALARMEEMDLTGGNHLTTNQLVAFFTEASRSTQLKKLGILAVNLSSIAPEVLTQAVTRVEELKLRYARLTDEQWLSLFTEISGSAQMKKLIMAQSNISSVDKEILSTALNRLDEVRLWNTGITSDQARAFFLKMAQNTNLKKLHIADHDLSTIDPEVLGNAVTKLKEADLISSHLSPEQITSILSRVLEPDNNLRELRLGPNCGHVNPEIVQKVKDKLKGKLEIW